jgi:hypothetical protein
MMRLAFGGARSLQRLSFILVATAALALSSGAARADAGWFESGDTLLHVDLQLLNDAEIIRLPVNQWPIPRAAVRYAMENAKTHFATNAAVSAALDRVRARLGLSEGGRSPGVHIGVFAHAGEAGLLRDFDTLSRENGDVGARAS